MIHVYQGKPLLVSWTFLASSAFTVVVQNSVPVARTGRATTTQQFIRQVGAALGVSAFVLGAFFDFAFFLILK